MLFFGYTKIKLTSNLSPEQYLAKLAPVVQPPKPYEWAMMPKPNHDGIIFEGRVKENDFSLVRLQRQRRGGRQAPPARIEATLRQTATGTDTFIYIFPNWQAIIVVLISFLFWGYVAIDSAPFSVHGVLQPTPNSFIFLPFFLLIYLTVLVAPVRDEAQALRLTLAQVIEDQPVKVMLR